LVYTNSIKKLIDTKILSRTMQYIGVDIVEIERIKQAVERWGERFLDRVFTAEELRLYSGKYQSLAARFAAKEAVLKALGTCNDGISWRDIEVLSDIRGKPTITLEGKAREVAQKMGVQSLDVTLSHSECYAVAFCVGTGAAEHSA
jgi:holo-[acyl-carrier protein] synthase